MSKLRSIIQLLTLLIFVVGISSVAHAQATRTWVSGVGDDLNPCSRTAPCKTYAGAISKTAKDGEISTLDPGGFGAVTITKSITINGGGAGQGYGSIVASLVNGIIINITDPADVRKSVRLDWLNINGVSTGLDGIRFLAGSALHVENTLIDGFTGDGIELPAGASGTFEMFVTNTTIRNCGNGIRMSSTGASVNVTVDSSRLSNNTNGVDVQAGTLNISRTLVSGNSTAGVTAGGSIGSVANVSNCTVMMNNNGIVAANGFATVRISGNEVYRNTGTGILNSGGTMETLRNNRARGNGTNQSGALTDVSAIGTGVF
jgi:hypothetical protein